jgi:hypothetical protein
MYSGRKQRSADRAGIDPGGPRQQVPDVSWLSEKLPVNRGNAHCPVSRIGQSRLRPGSRPGPATPPGQGMPAGQEGVARTARAGEGCNCLGLRPGMEYHSIPGQLPAVPNKAQWRGTY